MLDHAHAPGHDRRNPPLWHHARLSLRPLSEAILRSVREVVDPRGTEQLVVDVGCGDKPYLPFFDRSASNYIGVDGADSPADVIGDGTVLPFASASADVVVTTQTLEHLPDPAATIREAWRVLRPEGVLILSTHGTTRWHPVPHDYWRWTHEGLRKIVDDNGEWDVVSLDGAGGTAACFGNLIAAYLDAVLRRITPTGVGRVVMGLFNLCFEALDRIVPIHHPSRAALVTNYVLTAIKRDPNRAAI